MEAASTFHSVGPCRQITTRRRARGILWRASAAREDRGRCGGVGRPAAVEIAERRRVNRATPKSAAAGRRSGRLGTDGQGQDGQSFQSPQRA